MTVSYAASALQAQFTTFDPYAQQAQYEAMLQVEYMQQQVEWYTSNKCITDR